MEFTAMGMMFFIELIEKMLFAAIPATGFAMVFNVPVRGLKYCALLGAIGYGFRFVLIEQGEMSIEWASFCAAILVGIIGIQWSRWWLAHPKVFTVAAIIPLFPGIYAYTAMICAVKISQMGYSEVLFATLLVNFSKAAFIVGALSIGLSLPGIWLYRRRPSV